MASVQMATLQQDYSKQRFYNHDFSNFKLVKAKMRQSLFYHCNFDGADLTEADCESSDFIGSTFRNTILYRTNFRDAKLASTVFEPKDCFGITLTMECATFQNMHVGHLWWYGWLLFATMMEPRPQHEQVQGLDLNLAPLLKDKVIAAIGAERYVKLRALFGKRDF